MARQDENAQRFFQSEVYEFLGRLGGELAGLLEAAAELKKECERADEKAIKVGAKALAAHGDQWDKIASRVRAFPILRSLSLCTVHCFLALLPCTASLRTAVAVPLSL